MSAVPMTTPQPLSALHPDEQAARVRLAACNPAEVKSFRDAVLEADEELHQLIFAAAANRFIIAQLRQLQLLCRPYRVLRCAESADLEAIRGERFRVIDALLAHDLPAACAGLTEHFDRCRRFYLEPENSDPC